MLPGPGTYNNHVAKSMQLSRAFNTVIGSEKRFHVKTSEIQLNPGPGQYNPKKHNMHSSVSISIPHGTGTGRKSEVPGPGQYETESALVRSKTPSMMFNKADVNLNNSRS